MNIFRFDLGSILKTILMGLGISLGVSGVFALVFITAIFGAFLWPYTINAWLVHAGKAPEFWWGFGFMFGFVPILNRLMIPAAVITFISMLFLL